ncbi:YgcG family protein [uncultured Acidaminococcus sp.]|uniref:TPM domain-containing protein n=1 Tax=uncultured Acidaminococcus sp. TaxID=352152 RepID=UPI002634DD3D|nr:TPM domain-containing protein [uncultured Acidaminococcus sp.]
MKKLLRVLALLVFLVGMAVPGSAASALVLDQADLLRPQEEKALQQSLDKLDQKYQVRLAVVTVKSTGNVKPGAFANVMLDKIKDSRLKGNMVLLLSMKDRDWYISTDNNMRKMITDKAGIKALSGKFLPALKKNNYPEAFGQFAKGTDELLAYYQKEGKPYDPANAFNPLALAIAAAVSLGIGFLVRRILIGQMNNVLPALEAGAYLDRDSFQLEEDADNYLYMTVHRQPKSKESDHSADSTDENHGGGGGKF